MTRSMQESSHPGVARPVRARPVRSRAPRSKPPAIPGEKRARVVTVANQKGGVGKTTTVVNLAAYLAKMGHKILIIDMDSQANATSSFGISPGLLEASSYEVLEGRRKAKDVIQHTEIENLDILPAAPALAGAEVELVPEIAREFKLRKAITDILGDYEFIFIDCPPSLGLITLNAMCASDGIVAPVQCEYFSLEGIAGLVQSIQTVRNNLNGDLRLDGVLLTMYDSRTKLSSHVESQIRSFFRDRAYKTVIPRNVRLGEAPSRNKPIMLHDPRSSGAQAYQQLAKEFLETAGKKKSTGGSGVV